MYSHRPSLAPSVHTCICHMHHMQMSIFQLGVKKSIVYVFFLCFLAYKILLWCQSFSWKWCWCHQNDKYNCHHLLLLTFVKTGLQVLNFHHHRLRQSSTQRWIPSIINDRLILLQSFTMYSFNFSSRYINHGLSHFYSGFDQANIHMSIWWHLCKCNSAII